MGKIEVLSFEIANLIAAGEVVERPSSVLKELIENAIDAGATRIVAEIKRGGVSLIRVTDNGCGMTREDLPVAIKRHATSKIKDRSDLESIMTLGFRGEALAAIASVASLTIITKTADAACGSMLTAEGGEVIDISDVGAGDGTTIVVENLFYNVPARRKFLKKDSTEAMNVTALVEKIALSRSDVSIQLLIDGEEKFKTPGDGDLLHTIRAVLGRDFAEKVIAVDANVSGIHVHGFVGRSDNVRRNRNLENIFINGRYVKSLTVGAALEKAFTSFIAPECFPTCVLFLDMHPSTVDVNVHPAKLEIKFSDERPVFEAVYYSVKRAVETAEYRSELVFEEKKKGSIDFSAPRGEQIRMAGGGLSDRFPTRDVPSTPARDPMPRAASFPTGGRVASGAGDAYRDRTVGDLTPAHSLDLLKGYREATPIEPVPRQSASQNTPPSIAHTDATPDLPSYRYVGEAFDCYVMVEYNGDLLIIDKHAAHERVIFEELKRSRAQDGRIASQPLLLPICVALTPSEASAAVDFSEEISAVGFDFTVRDEKAEITAIPDAIDVVGAEGLFVRMLDELAQGSGTPDVTEAIRREKALYQIACKAAIKGGRTYDRAVIDWLIGKVLTIPDITVCPHGRPIVYLLTKRELDRQFERIK